MSINIDREIDKWTFTNWLLLIRFSWVSEWVKSLSHVQLFATPWTIAHQAPPSMGFSRQEYCSGLPFPSPEDLPNPGIEPRSPALQADALTSEPAGKSLIFISLYKFVISRSLLWSSDLPLLYFCGLFPSLSFSHHHSGLLFPILTTEQCLIKNKYSIHVASDVWEALQMWCVCAWW